ncbi:MAG: hypothetical protein A2474_02820 [Elusimicrobia bacterium RIFOXYC2_FULL_34_12]|nr:MAG: hypothetical protein A2474_02820 [Elusimicrobia bacterium RIFOXYC2_FULL_34_12]OGS38896.1 MAG: hypothetical protein A2551_03490 [Elusimicrobia bacterium RIFOXYD2_FULL_34_30]HAM39011.1 hypothetical protein [Elusimicrobiota bacterium]
MYKILFLSIILLFNSCGKKPGIISSKEYGKFYTEGIKEKKWVAITFDDGPKPEVLDKILNALKKENIKATFFVVGMNMKLYPKYAKKYLVNGHEIGNHTYSHRNYYLLEKNKNDYEIENILLQELEDGATVINEITGIRPVFMRMPNGYISPIVKKVAKERKHIIINWTFGCDWHDNKTKDELIKKYLKTIEPGMILIFHEKKITADVLPVIIKGIKAKGFEIVPLRQILGFQKAEYRG